MGDRCENCERVAAELRAEFDRLRNEFVHRIEVMLDKTQAAIDYAEGRNSELLTDIETKNLGLLADIDRRVQRLFDTLSDRLQNPSGRTDQGLPKLN
jgi:hypothetical protein